MKLTLYILYYNLQLRSSGGDGFECHAIDVAAKP